MAPAGWCLLEADTDSVITKLRRLERLVLRGGIFRTPTLRALPQALPPARAPRGARRPELPHRQGHFVRAMAQES